MIGLTINNVRYDHSRGGCALGGAANVISGATRLSNVGRRWEFRAEQQRHSTLREIPVIVMSALPDLDRRAAALGVAACLNKPIVINVLLGMIAQ
jgi:hypothetical protein